MSSLSLSGLANGLPLTDPTRVPAAVRTGGATAKQAYATGVAFEQMLAQQLTQELEKTTSSDSGGSGGSDGSGGLLGSGSSGMLGQLLPQTLSDSLTGAGGLGVANEIAASIDPALRGKLG